MAEALASWAESQIGRRERGGENKGAELAAYFAADDYDPNGDEPGDDGYPWCAAFVSEGVQRAAIGKERDWKLPRLCAAYGFEEWARRQPDSVQLKTPTAGDLKRGDIVCFRFSHVGIVVEASKDGETVRTVEGNTNQAGSRDGDGVWRKSRMIRSIRSRVRFI